MASWIDALASRSGPLGSAAQHFAARHGIERDPPRGVAGLLTLRDLTLRLLADQAEEQTDETERRFIEGAGAYLGLLLLDHVGEGAHSERGGEHRLHLGRHGTFDPFAGMARVLEADDARAALLAEVALAEAEARGEGPAARVVREVERQLEALDLRVRERWADKLWVDQHGQRVEIDLGRVVEVTRGESSRTLEGAVRRVCAALAPDSGPSELPWEAVRERIFPRLQGRAFVDALPSPKSLHLLQLAREVWVTLVLRYEERARYVRVDEIETWSKDGATPLAQALQNLAHAYERARFARHDTASGPLVIAESRDGLDAARLLLPGVRALFCAELGSPCVVGVPHRDTLLAAPLSSPSAIATLQERVDEAVSRAPHAISRSLLIVNEQGVLSELHAADGGSTSDLRVV